MFIPVMHHKQLTFSTVLFINYRSIFKKFVNYTFPGHLKISKLRRTFERHLFCGWNETFSCQVSILNKKLERRETVGRTVWGWAGTPGPSGRKHLVLSRVSHRDNIPCAEQCEESRKKKNRKKLTKKKYRRPYGIYVHAPASGTDSPVEAGRCAFSRSEGWAAKKTRTQTTVKKRLWNIQLCC